MTLCGLCEGGCVRDRRTECDLRPSVSNAVPNPRIVMRSGVMCDEQKLPDCECVKGCVWPEQPADAALEKIASWSTRLLVGSTNVTGSKDETEQ